MTVAPRLGTHPPEPLSPNLDDPAPRSDIKHSHFSMDLWSYDNIGEITSSETLKTFAIKIFD
jgi:hypothetical protein